jgi:outer membrane immunogenic protein
MKKLLLSTSFFVASTAAVLAADFPMQTKSPIVAAPVFTWTGCYVGAHVGGGTMTSINTEGGNQNPIGKGAIAGGQAGCNYQDGNWVVGLEGEGSWSGIKTTSNSTTVPNIFNPGNASIFDQAIKNNNDFAIAARAGITFDRTLIYGKGGWAWGSFNSNNVSGCCGLGFVPSTFTQSGTLDGFLVGVGIEHALTRNWTIKAEYNYIGFGSKELSTTQCTPGIGCGVTGTSSLGATKQLFKVGANYLFDFGGGPVVARY